MGAHGKNSGVFVSTPDGGRIKVSTSTKGAINEYIAMTWLMSQGYDVFRNASPTGRADLVAKNWDTDELIWIDVKSEGYDPDGFGNLSDQYHDQKRKYAASGIKYLVVGNNGECNWYGEGKISPLHEGDKYWTDPASGQTFLHPRYELKNEEWKVFCHWMLKYYVMTLTQPQAEILRGCSRSVRYKRGKETLQKVRNFLYRRITGKEPFPIADNDNAISKNAESVSEAA